MRKLVTAVLATTLLADTFAMAAPASAQYWAPPPPHAWGPPPPPPPYAYDDWQRHRYWEWRHHEDWRHREWCRWHDCWR
jgi:hypothetical protein